MIPNVDEPRFDWYAATVRADVADLLRDLAAGLGGEVVQGRPKQGYAVGHWIQRDGSTVATVYSGGRNGHPHVFASSDDTEPFVNLIRSTITDPTSGEVRPRFPHHVTRMDAAIDFDGGDGTWDTLYEVCKGLALERGLSISQAGDWIRNEAGRTFYIGSHKSAVFARLYEKGKQLRGLAIDGGEDISPNLVRLEVVVRPDGVARHRAAEGTPLEAFGYADWAKELLRLVYGEQVERVHIRERRESDHERAMHWLIRQYGEHLRREAEAVGGWENLGPALGRRIEKESGETRDGWLEGDDDPNGYRPDGEVPF